MTQTAVSSPKESPGGKLGLSTILSRDFIASIVVFLVAMPLCMGIAVASGVPAERGLINELSVVANEIDTAESNSFASRPPSSRRPPCAC